MSEIAIKWCRYCGRVVPLATADCPYCGRNTIRGVQTTRECPFCGEDIKASAIKCKHCGEFLDGRERSDGSPAPAQGGPTIIIEKAIIAQRGGSGGAAPEIRLLRPDGTPIESGQLGAGGRPTMALGPAAPKALTGETANPALPVQSSVRPEVVDDEGNALPAVVRPGEAPLASVPPPAPPPARREKKKEPPRPAPSAAPGEPEMIVCPSCARVVFEDDNFCENCGHDMSKPVVKAASPRQERVLFKMTRYALLLSAGAPAFLAFHLPLGMVVSAGAGVSAGVLSFSRIGRSKDRLTGRTLAVAACLVGLLWLVLGFACM